MTTETIDRQPIPDNPDAQPRIFLQLSNLDNNVDTASNEGGPTPKLPEKDLEELRPLIEKLKAYYSQVDLRTETEAKSQPQTPTSQLSILSRNDATSGNRTMQIHIPDILKLDQTEQDHRRNEAVEELPIKLPQTSLGVSSGSTAKTKPPTVDYLPISLRSELDLKQINVIVDHVLDRILKQLILIFLLMVMAAGSLTFAYFRLREFPLSQYGEAWNEFIKVEE